MGLIETELAPPPPLGGVYPHLVGVLTEKVFLNMGPYGSFFCLMANARHLPGVGEVPVTGV